MRVAPLRLLAVSLALAATGASAQSSASTPSTTPLRSTSTSTPCIASARCAELRFGEDVIEAGVPAPQGVVVTTRPTPAHRSLIRLRTDFRAEVLSSVSRL
jgi:hypothetical protein